jgi:hypothetical protein
MKTRVLKLSLAFTLASVSPAVVSSQTPQSIAVAAEIPPGPSMKETEEWITRELKPLGSHDVLEKFPTGLLSGDKYEIESAVLTECRLRVRQTAHHYFARDGERSDVPNRQIETGTITLKDVDLGRLVPREALVLTGYTANKPSYRVFLSALADRGDPFLLETSGYQGGPTKKPGRIFPLRIRDQSSANKVTEVLRRAAVLCGAPNPPPATVLTAVAPATQGPQSTPVSPSASKMTNEQVIQLVTAGLSEQVITTSIRQAADKGFDLTAPGLIALKKAGVSDVLILVMQESGRPAQPALASAAPAPPKYDASLADSAKPTAAAPLANGCSGVELMGLYKEDMRPVAPLIVSLAKIRNGTALTRIVIIDWLDMYGQPKKSQTEVRAGEIASLELSRNMAGERLPINVRLSSCR